MADQHSLHRVRIANNDQGPRYVHTSRGMEVIAKEGFIDTEVTSAQGDAIENSVIANSDGVPMFDIETISEGDDGSDEKPLSSLSLTNLRKLATAEEVPLKGRKDDDGNDLPDLKSAKDIADAIQAKRDANAQG